MTALSIQPTFPTFTDSDGTALDDGYIWIGVAGSEPISTPLTAYWDAALTQVVTQPVRTRGGYPLNAGAIGRLYVNSNYSIKVRNRNGFDLYSSLTATERYSEVVVNTNASQVVYNPAGTGAVATTVQTKLRESVSVLDFGAVGDGVADDTVAIQLAITFVRSVGGRVVVPQGTYLISNSLNMGDETTTYSFVELIGEGLPTIKSNNFAAPIIKVGGAFMKLEGLFLRYTSQPAVTDTNAAAIRTYNLAYSIIQRIYVYEARNGIDMYQGVVAGTGYNACFSNTISDIVIQRYTGYGIIMVPTVGGNSGSVWSNIYINHRIGATAASSGATLGAFWLQTAQNEVIDLLNLEWQRNSGSLIVLNQSGNCTFRGVHIEGVYPTTAYSPLIDILGGSNDCPTFDCITLVGNDWTGYGGANIGSLFRLNGASPARVLVSGVQCYSNTNPSYLIAVNYGGATAYGSIIEFNSVVDGDGSLSGNSGWSPKVSFGAVTANVLYPLQRWNQFIPKHFSLVTDNAGGTASAVFSMTGTGTDDAMGLWNSGAVSFIVKQAGTYNCSVTIPTGTSPVVNVQKGFVSQKNLTVTPGNPPITYQMYLNYGESVQFVLVSGSYTRTGVTFSVGLAA